MIRVEELKQKCKVYIDGEMTIYNAMELKEKLFPLLSDKRDLEINLSNVIDIDSAGVQLLMLARKNRAESNKILNLTEHSSAVLDVFELMDLVTFFNDPVVLPGKKGVERGA